MTAPRTTLGLIVLVTVVLVISSFGLIHDVSVTGASPAAASPAAALTPSSAAASPSASSSSHAPATLNAGTNAQLTASAASGPISAPPTPLVDQTHLAATSVDASSPLASQILSSLEAKGVSPRYIELPYLLNGPSPGLTNGHVNLSYTSSPAPYGIGEFGLKNVSGVITPYRLSTPSVEANFSTNYLSGYSAGLSSPDEWGVQLNAVLNNVTLFGKTGYQFWTQNVFEYSPSLKALIFVSNIWNFSNSHATLSCNFLYQSDGTVVCPTYYYGVTGYIPATEPFHLQLYLNSTLIGGRDAVFFNFSLTSGLGTESSNFNYAIFNSLATGGNPALTPKPVYIANGFQYNPLGLPDDFEITLGGPGGGSNFDVFESEETYMSLQYYNTTLGAYLTVPSAYNVGGETGETSVGVNAAWAQFGSGTFPTACVACADLSNGPSFQYGLWGVGGTDRAGNVVPEIAWGSQSGPYLIPKPANAFVFIAEGFVFTTWTTTNWSLFQWVPNFAPYTLLTTMPVGNYTVVAVLGDYSAILGTFTLNHDSGVHPVVNLAVALDTTIGVNTPLWAFNATGLAAISSGTDYLGNYILYNNQYAPIGQDPIDSDVCVIGNCAYFPWFGLINDYGFQVFPGILLDGVVGVDVLNAPSFDVAVPGAPSQAQNTINYFGLPSTNDLQMFFWGDDVVNLEGSTIGGWFPAVSDFGPSASFASVVYWNTSYSDVSANTFNVGGMGLFLYGGYDNYLWNNTFVQGSAPVSPDPYSTAAAYYGSIGLVDADFGDAEFYGAAANSLCDYCDTIWNNVFDTVITATSPYLDPYTGTYPNQYPYDFSQAWNVPYEPGVKNIIGGNYLGGNYYWDYGSAENPYGVLPDVEINYLPEYEFATYPGYIGGEYGLGGDYYPLVNVPLYKITFKEQGLPKGVDWYVYVYVPPEYFFQGDYAYNTTAAPGTNNFTETTGSWFYEAYTFDQWYSATNPFGYATVNATTGNVVVTIVFQTAYILTVHETGLPKGTYWYGESYNSSVGYHANYTHTGSENNISGMIAGTYDWWAATYYSNNNQYAMIPGVQAAVTISANTTVNVVFVPVFFLYVNALGLPTGTLWIFTLSNVGEDYGYWWWQTGTWRNFTAPDLTYNFTATSAGYAPHNGTVTLSANTTLTINFQAAAGLTFSETGLPSGTPWTVTLTQGTTVTTLSGTGSSIVFNTVVGPYSYTVSSSGYAATPSSGSGTLTTNSVVSVTFVTSTLTFTDPGLPAGTPWTVTLTQGSTVTTLAGTGSSIVFTGIVGSFTYTISATGYVATPSSGSGTMPANAAISVSFAVATGTLSGTVSPSGATLWVDGTQQTLGSGGTYSVTLPVGTHSIEVTDSGYVTYYNNATTSAGVTTTLNIALTSTSTSSGYAGISTTGWVLIALLAVLAVVFLVMALIFARRRGRQPPPVAPYSPTPAAGTGAPPEGSSQPWQEPEAPPPGTS
jgi:thermopsin